MKIGGHTHIVIGTLYETFQDEKTYAQYPGIGLVIDLTLMFDY